MSRLRRLLDRIEALEMILGIRMPVRDELAARELLRAVGCQPGAFKIIGMLLKRELVTIDSAAIALSADSEPRSAQLIETYIVRARKALVPHGIGVDNVRGSGWRLTEPNKRKLRALLDSIAEAA